MAEYFYKFTKLIILPIHFIYTCALFQRLWTTPQTPPTTPYTSGRYTMYAPGYNEVFDHSILPVANQIVLPPCRLYSAKQHTNKIINAINNCPEDNIDCIGFSLSAQPVYSASLHTYKKDVRFAAINGATSLKDIFMHRQDLALQLLGLTTLLILVSITIVASALSINFYKLWILTTALLTLAIILLILPATLKRISSLYNYPGSLKNKLDTLSQSLSEYIQKPLSLSRALIDIVPKIISIVLFIPIYLINTFIYPFLGITITYLCALNTQIVAWIFESIDSNPLINNTNPILLYQSETDLTIPDHARLLSKLTKQKSQTTEIERIENSLTFFLINNNGHDRNDTLSEYKEDLDTLKI